MTATPQAPAPEEQKSALETFGQDFTALAEEGALDPVIGRDEEIRRIMQVLTPPHQEQRRAHRRARRRARPRSSRDSPSASSPATSRRASATAASCRSP